MAKQIFKGGNIMIYDVIIIGGGPAGLAAGLYAARARMSTLIIEKDAYGGQIVTTADVENYPGSIEDPTGPILVDRMLKQTEGFGAKKVSDTVVEVNLDEKIKVIKGEKEEYKAKSVIVATGAVPRPMGCPGEKELTGRGVSYCATCDGSFFEELEVYVVGGGDSAVEEAAVEEEPPQAVIPAARTRAATTTATFLSFIFQNLLTT